MTIRELSFKNYRGRSITKLEARDEAIEAKDSEKHNDADHDDDDDDDDDDSASRSVCRPASK